MIHIIQEVIDALQDHSQNLSEKTATIGFDGFIDVVVRLIKEKENVNSLTFFNEIEEFGHYINSKQGISGCVELHEQFIKMGGNMPIMSNALARLGIKVNCIGALGLPHIQPEFIGMKETGCTLYSIAEPGNTLALEFQDGKIMLARMQSLDQLSWENIKDIVGTDALIELYKDSDLIGILNWSEIEQSSHIYEGILEDIVPYSCPSKSQVVFFDLSDCSKKVEVDINKILNIINAFSAHYTVILGMNENEARLIYQCLSHHQDEDLKKMGNFIYNALDIDAIAIHSTSHTMAWEPSGSHHITNYVIEHPIISTGAGDHFNAGFCLGRLLGLNLTASMILGNATAGHYIKNGYSGNMEEVITFMKLWKNIL